MTQPHVLLSIAADAISHRLQHLTYSPPPLHPPWLEPRGVFVTLWNDDKSLRGCMGHIRPVRDSLANEVADVAALAATRDPRFKPVSISELSRLTISLSLLEPSEPIRGVDQLDPKKWGVIVSCTGRRGVLLPNIDGVSTAEQQVAIALRKAGIEAHEDWSLSRFAVTAIGKDND